MLILTIESTPTDRRKSAILIEIDDTESDVNVHFAQNYRVNGILIGIFGVDHDVVFVTVKVTLKMILRLPKNHQK